MDSMRFRSLPALASSICAVSSHACTMSVVRRRGGLDPHGFRAGLLAVFALQELTRAGFIDLCSFQPRMYDVRRSKEGQLVSESFPRWLHRFVQFPATH